MAEETFNFIFCGELIEGAELATVKANLSRLLKLQVDDDNVKRIFCGRPIVIKKNLDLDTAKKYQQAFAKAGALGSIKSSNGATAEHSLSSTPAAKVDDQQPADTTGFPLLGLLGAGLFVVVNSLLTISVTPAMSNVGTFAGFVFGRAFALPLLLATVLCVRKQHRSPRRFVRIFNWVSLVVLVSLLPQIVQDSGKSWQQIVNNDHRIEISVPGNWQRNEPDAANELINVSNEKAGEVLLIRYLEKSPEYVGLETEARRGVERITNGMILHQVQDPTLSMINNLRVVEYILEVEFSGQRIIYVYDMFDGGDYVYLLLLGVKASSFESQKERLSKIVNSFTLI